MVMTMPTKEEIERIHAELEAKKDFSERLDKLIMSTLGDLSKMDSIHKIAVKQSIKYVSELNTQTPFNDNELNLMYNAFVSGYLLRAGILDF
jgi:hypothetical protein